MATLATIDTGFPYTKDLPVHNCDDAKSDLAKTAISQLFVGGKNYVYLIDKFTSICSRSVISGTITFRTLEPLKRRYHILQQSSQSYSKLTKSNRQTYHPFAFFKNHTPG